MTEDDKLVLGRRVDEASAAFNALEEAGMRALARMKMVPELAPIAALATEIFQGPDKAGVWLVLPDSKHPERLSPLAQIKSGDDGCQAIHSKLTLTKVMMGMGN